MSSLRPFQWTYPQKTGSCFTIIPRFSTTNADIEQHFLQLATRLKNFDVVINHNLPFLLHGYLKEWIHKVQKLQLRVIYQYMNEIERSLKLIDNDSSGSANQQQKHAVHAKLNRTINDLTDVLERFQAKARFINDLVGRSFSYYDVGESTLERTDSMETVRRILVKDRRNDRVLCSNDTLYSMHQSRLKILVHQLVEERRAQPHLRLVYADFSNSSFPLHDFAVLSSKDSPSDKSLSLPLTNMERSASSSRVPPDVINILLLGETGVGKSTFINAFANYLTFDTLERAQSHQPAVVIPVSFVITVDQNFTEQIVRFGDTGESSTEDFSHPGQSVTQRCQSYTFNLAHPHTTKLRIIDTPGFGDTRGTDHDERNMQHIIEYLHDVTHVNAVCFLLKPNVSRLSVSFRACLNGLLEVLGERAEQNVVFCFTNARSTFYTPGNTAPLLQAVLKSLSTNDVPFKKENTFCFDNESFRYLVALQNDVQFDEDDKQAYTASWSTSVNESHRLLSYIRTQLRAYPLDDEWQSVKRAHIEISRMIRPMLEAMRNILRNKILWNADPVSRSIKLRPQAVHRRSAFCLSCRRDAFYLGKFWILPDDAHEFHNRCLTCACSPDQHIATDYILGYDVTGSSSDDHAQKMKDFLEQLHTDSVAFACFLLDVAHAEKEDPFLTGFKRMIVDENRICTDYESNQCNVRLVEELQKCLISHEEQMKKMQSAKKPEDVQSISRKIKTVGKYPMIDEQLAAIRQYRENYQEEQREFEISANSMRRKICVSTLC